MMLCCCRKGQSSSYALGDKDGQPNPNSIAQDAHIQTGKGALSNSNQNIGPEAELDKSTISATQQREKTPVTEQPLQASTASHNNQSPPSPAPPQEDGSKEEQSLDASQIEIVSKASEETEIKAQNSSPQFTSTISVGGGSNNPRKSTNFDSEFGSIEIAITQMEKGSVQEAKSIVPQLATQLQALTLQVTQAGQGHMMSDQGLQSAVSRLEAVASRLEALATRGPGQAPGVDEEDAPFVADFDTCVNNNLATFLSLSNTVGGLVKTQADMVKEIFQIERSYLVIASKHKKPSDAVNAELLKPMSSKIEEIQALRDKNRSSEFFNHLSTIAESIPALGWITVDPAPPRYVNDMLESGMFYSNRVVKDHKGTNPTHVDWTRSWTKIIKDLHEYVKNYHPRGLTWNPQGAVATATAAPAGGPPPPPPAGAPPPPPPPGPPPPPMDLSGSDGSDDAKSALFASINQGDAVTKGLRKVTDDMKTHKNPALRQGPAPFKPTPSPKPATAPKPGAPKPPVTPAKQPVTELQEKKWIVEYHKDNKNIKIEGDIRQTVYVFKCEGSVIQIKGKINSIVFDSCKKSAVVLDDVLSSVEFVNCQSVQGQVNGTVNTLSIDKTDGCQFYLSKDSLGVEIVTAKSSEMNILVPAEDGDFKEFALPEQYKTTYDGKKMITVATESI